MSKNFCIWIVPPNDGRVRKLRLTVGRVVACAGLFFILGASAMLVAGDYVRIQFQKARMYFTLHQLASEREALLDSKEHLESHVKNLEGENSRVLSYEQQIKQRLQELSALIQGSVVGPGFPAADNTAGAAAMDGKSARSSGGESVKDGIGGAEVSCLSPLGCGLPPHLGESASGTADTLRADESGLPASARAMLRNMSFSPLNDRALIAELDRYIDALRNLPLGSPGNGHVNSGFGLRVSPFTSQLSMHEGLDFALSDGSEVVATADGVVSSVEHTPTYGLVIDIQHSDRVVTRFAHLSRAFVKEGDRVCRGEALGLVGSSGRATGPHLHYEVRVDGQPKDPAQFVQLAARLEQIVHEF